MAKHVHGSTKLSDAFATMDYSESIFNELVLESVDRGYLSCGDATKKVNGKRPRYDITEKQRDFLDDVSYIRRDGTRRVTACLSGTRSSHVPVYTDGASTVAKAPFYLTSKIAHSPFREMNEASLRERKSILMIDAALKTAVKKGFTDPAAYMVTLTIPNVDQHHLMDGYRDVSKSASKLTKALKDGTNKKNGLRLRAEAGHFVKFAGGLISIEITVNPDKLKNHDHQGLFHPHAHILMIFDGRFDQIDARRTLFSYWEKLVPQYQLSSKAFDIEEAYDHVDGSLDLGKCVKEVTAYATKPDFYTRFRKLLATGNDSDTDYACQVFSELFHTIKGRTTKRNIGVMRDAAGFVKWLDDGYAVTKNGHKTKYSILPAVLAATTVDDHVPDILTKKIMYYHDRTGGHFTKPQQLSSLEIIYANRSLLEQCLWSLPDIDWPNNSKADLYQYLLKTYSFFEPSMSGLDSMFNSWTDQRQSAVDDLNLDIQSLEAELTVPHNPQQLNRIADQIRHDKVRLNKARQQLIDVQHLDCVRSLFVHSFQFRFANWSAYYRRLALYDAFDVHHIAFDHGSVRFDGLDEDGSCEVEKRLCHVFLDQPDGESFTYIPNDILHDYKEYKLGHDCWLDHPVLWSDFSIRDRAEVRNQMTADLFKKWIDSTLDPSANASHVSCVKVTAWASMFSDPSDANCTVTDDDDDFA